MFAAPRFPNDDRRRRPRARISVAVRQRCEGREVLCQAGDINSHGMLLATIYDRPLPHDARCWLEFSLPESDVLVRTRADVVWQDRQQHYQLMAVRFAVLAPSHRRLIEEYTRQQPAVPPPPFVQR